MTKLTTEEFVNKVMSYKGKYPERELRKFVTYFTERKHFSTFKTFHLERRLATWFSPKRAEKFKKKKLSQEQIRLKALKNSLGKFNPLR